MKKLAIGLIVWLALIQIVIGCRVAYLCWRWHREEKTPSTKGTP